MSLDELDSMFRELEQKVPKKEEPKEEKIEVKELEVEKKVEKPLPPPVELPKGEIKEDVASAKLVILIYGEKGCGKTMQAFSFPGEIACLSFDQKSMRIKQNKYNKDDRIHVFDMVKFMDYTDQSSVTQSSSKTYEYINAVLEHLEKTVKPDWIVIDGSDIFHTICEWTMRFRHGIEAFAGIQNLNLWKERRLLMRQIHNRCLQIANRGVIYTTYSVKDDLVVDGELVLKKDVPQWIDVIMYATDVVIHAFTDPVSRTYRAKIITSKDDALFPSGRSYDVTDKKLWEVIENENKS